MQQWADIRRRVLQEGVSKRQILRETGMHWQTLEKILTHSQPPGYRRTSRGSGRSWGRTWSRIREILEQDKQIPKKQRHTAKRIFERLREEGYTRRLHGGQGGGRRAEAHQRRGVHAAGAPPGRGPGGLSRPWPRSVAPAEGGDLRDGPALHRRVLLLALPRECTESFWEGHKRAFEFFGGVPRRISYDNSKIAVPAIIGVHRRELTRRVPAAGEPLPVRAPLLPVRRGNEKGVVENTGGYARRNFLVPVPQVATSTELNT